MPTENEEEPASAAGTADHGLECSPELKSTNNISDPAAQQQLSAIRAKFKSLEAIERLLNRTMAGRWVFIPLADVWLIDDGPATFMIMDRDGDWRQYHKGAPE